MTTPDPQFRLLSAYPVTQDVTMRIGDLDPYRHVSAIRIGEYYEEARAIFYRDAFAGLERPRILVLRLTFHYLAESVWPGALTVGTGIAKIGNSSFEMVQGLFRDGVCLGVAETILVNTGDSGKAPLPDSLRSRLEPRRLNLPEATA